MSELAEICSLVRQKAETIGLLHDAAKDLSQANINLLIKEGQINLEAIMIRSITCKVQLMSALFGVNRTKSRKPKWKWIKNGYKDLCERSSQGNFLNRFFESKSGNKII